jgi:hypothetical protein
MATDPDRASNTTYLYKLRARRGVESAFTSVELATMVMFQDATLIGSRIKAIHVSQLRSAVNAVRTAAAGGPRARVVPRRDADAGQHGFASCI